MNKPIDTGVIEFTLEDRNGDSHAYMITLIPGREGMRLAFQLQRELGEAFGSIFSAGEGIDLDDEDVAGEELAKGLDFGKLGAALRKIDPDALGDLGERLLSNALRDGKDLKGSGFDRSYRGNYNELYAALIRVIQENDFIPFFGGSDETE